MKKLPVWTTKSNDQSPHRTSSFPDGPVLPPLVGLWGAKHFKQQSQPTAYVGHSRDNRTNKKDYHNVVKFAKVYQTDNLKTALISTSH